MENWFKLKKKKSKKKVINYAEEFTNNFFNRLIEFFDYYGIVAKGIEMKKEILNYDMINRNTYKYSLHIERLNYEGYLVLKDLEENFKKYVFGDCFKFLNIYLEDEGYDYEHYCDLSISFIKCNF